MRNSNWHRSAIGLMVSVLVLAGLAGIAQGQIVADPSVSEIGYDTFEGLSPEDRYFTLDSIDFWAVPREAPENYYDGVDLSGEKSQFRQSIHDLIRGHEVYPYSSSATPDQSSFSVDTWDIIAVADAHPRFPRTRVLDIYLNGTFDRQSKGVTTNPRYDREHSWPKSLGFPKKSTTNPAYSDCHHLFAAYNSYNSSRSNKPYANPASSAGCNTLTTLENMGRGGGLTHSGSANESCPDRYQTWMGRRGDVARAMFYMALRYEGDAPGEADLKLTSNLSNVVKDDDAWKDNTDAFMGALDNLLEWHRQDPVDDLERRRNTVVYVFQDNRNPFVDNPGWVDVLYGDAGVPDAHAAELAKRRGPTAWINEFHYDNTGADQNEFVEIAGPAGTSLEGWSLVGYSGNGGRSYRTIPLAGSIPNQSEGFGALAFDFEGLQNGARDQVSSPDAIALVDASGHVVQFLSYEGFFSAVDGPAMDMPSTDIGADEPANTPAGSSLQLQGSGSTYADFTWNNANTASPGRINADQSIVDE